MLYLSHNQLLLTIGRNLAVQAFQENLEVNHNNDLVERLNAGSKKVEAAVAIDKTNRLW